MITIQARRCIINQSDQVVVDTIGDLKTYNINEHQIVKKENYSKGDYPSTDVYLCSRFVGFIINK